MCSVLCKVVLFDSISYVLSLKAHLFALVPHSILMSNSHSLQMQQLASSTMSFVFAEVSQVILALPIPVFTKTMSHHSPIGAKIGCPISILNGSLTMDSFVFPPAAVIVGKWIRLKLRTEAVGIVIFKLALIRNAKS